MIYSPATEIAFSQVREDPLIELQIINRLVAQQQHRLRILLVASGGCTALSLLVNPDVETIEAVDLNPAQLHLVELRRQALLHLSLEQQLRLIGVDAADEIERLSLYDKLRLYLPDVTQAFWDKRREQIAFGVNRVGKFEQLFRELAAEFSKIGLDPLICPATAIEHARWREVFEFVFERNQLAKIFGEAAVNYSMDRSFGEHFADVMARSLLKFSPESNYFLTQVWRDSYANSTDGLPLYLQASAQTAIRALGVNRLKLHQGAFAVKMTELGELDKFDLIQFSNISDWMPLPDLHQMLASAVSCLKPGGALIGRRLNGDHHLAAVMSEHISVDDSLSAALLKSDRSFFYREVAIAFNIISDRTTLISS